MQELRIYQVDAFTNQVFKGNPAAVVPLEDWLPEEVMQDIALENNLSETAFFVPRGGSFQLRWFTPTVEVDLCGHATLATAHVLFKHLHYQQERIAFHTRSGQLNVTRYGDGYTLDFPTDRLQPVETPLIIKEALGRMPLQTFLGREDYLAIFATQDEIASLQPDFPMLKGLKSRGLIVSAPGRDVDFVSRGFFPNAGVDEDPVTGSAHTTLTPYWASILGKEELSARQISQRGGDLRCRLKNDRVELTGQAITFMKGQIFI